MPANVCVCVCGEINVMEQNHEIGLIFLPCCRSAAIDLSLVRLDV